MGTPRRTSARNRILGRRELAAAVARWRRAGKRVVFTSGCYDLLHVGHVRSFEAARALGDVLVVGVNRDRRVRQLKGPGRPLVPERQRAELIAALASVEAVALFPEDSAAALIRALRPDVVCKGGEYRGERIPEQIAIESVGGRFVHLRQVPGVRTSLLVARMRG
jgi:rfaE bifunctional protein nucleotidyltransferase chain/domain